jgi:hypothetical protein
MTQRTEVLTPFGYCVEYYRDDDNDSGYGWNPQRAVWWGRLADAPIEPSRWAALGRDTSPDPFDVACESRFDAA